jgi:hypothetical protein
MVAAKSTSMTCTTAGRSREIPDADAPDDAAPDDEVPEALSAAFGELLPAP